MNRGHDLKNKKNQRDQSLPLDKQPHQEGCKYNIQRQVIQRKDETFTSQVN